MIAFAKPNLWNDEPITVQCGDIWQLGTHRLMCGDSPNAEDVSRLMQGEKADLIFADPPYGIGIDAWDVALEDVPSFIALVTANLKQCGFFAFTHQMPHMVEWLHVLKSSQLRYKDHVAWVKRVATSMALPLMRGHESLFIYSNGNQSYYQTKGRYSDVRVPGLFFDLITIEGIERYISHLQAKVNGVDVRTNTGISGHKSYAYANDRLTDRSPECVNFTNVWSFLPEHRKQHGTRANHPTGKPTLLMNRLIELTTPDNALVYDVFLGSGTTLISAENTNRTCYGMELSPEYCELAIQRWQEQTEQQAQRVEVSA